MPKAGIQSVAPSSLLQGESRRIQGINSGIDDLKILGTPFRAAVSDALLGPITVTRSIDEATYLTIPLADESGQLRQSKLLQSAFTLELDGLYFRHAGLDRGDDGSITLRPRSREVARLMASFPKNGPTEKIRGKVWTRAEFIGSLITKLHPAIPFYCPELHTRQPIKSERQARQDDVDRDVRRDRGLNRDVHLTVKGVAATAEQVTLADRMMRVGESVGATDEGLVGLITAAINETTIKNLSYGDRTSTGPLQVLVSTAQNLGIDPRNVEQIVDAFFTRGFTGAGGMNQLLKRGTPLEDAIGLVMYSANGTTYPGLQYIPEAREWVNAFGGSANSAPLSVEAAHKYAFEQKPNESIWACMKRLGDEVNWRRFEAAGIVYYIAETDLLDSRVRMEVSEDAPGIDGISWRYDSPRKVQELQVTGRAKAWAAPPGSVAHVRGEGELADGKYIVAEIESSLGDEAMSATLRRPTPPLPEPAAETTTKTFGGFSGSDSAVGESSEPFQKMVEEAERIEDLHLSYVFGGGHVAGIAPANGPFDCSSAVSRILQVGGFLDTTMATGALASWGEPGKGDLVTVYVHNGGAGGGHTFIQLGDRYWGTSSSNPGGGPGFISVDSGYIAGFESVRHPNGL